MEAIDSPVSDLMFWLYVSGVDQAHQKLREMIKNASR
jgi:hypothetical protein